jgi:hypothetical protein
MKEIVTKHVSYLSHFAALISSADHGEDPGKLANTFLYCKPTKLNGIL